MADPSTLVRRLLLWTVVCCVSAAPSFVLASDGFDRPAMVLGVALFVLAYTAVTSTAGFQRFHDRPFVRRTLYIGYGTRLLLSVAFPLGVGADMMPGMLSIGIVRGMGLEPHGFEGTLATTVVQGTLLNLLLAFFMAGVYGVQKAFMAPPPAPKGFDVIMPAIPAARVEPLK